jgi:hypothetical protein
VELTKLSPLLTSDHFILLGHIDAIGHDNDLFWKELFQPLAYCRRNADRARKICERKPIKWF